MDFFADEVGLFGQHPFPSWDYMDSQSILLDCLFLLVGNDAEVVAMSHLVGFQ